MRFDTHALQPLVRIGKAGITPAVVDEIQKHLKKRRVIKVKFFPSALHGREKKEFGKELASQCQARLVSQVGFVVVLARE